MRKDISDLIKKNNVITFGFKKSFENVERYLSEDETVLYICTANTKVGNAEDIKVDITNVKGKIPTIFLITDKRIIFYFIVLGNEQFKQFPSAEVREYSFKRVGIFGCVLRITTLLNKFDIDLKWKKETVEIVTEALEKSKREPNGAENKEQTDNINKIKRLSDLKEQGIISEDEFNEKKKEILSRI